MYCKNCGNEIKEDENFCSVCGAKAMSEATDNQTETVEVAASDNKQNKSKKKSFFILITIILILAIIALILCKFVFADSPFKKVINQYETTLHLTDFTYKINGEDIEALSVDMVENNQYLASYIIKDINSDNKDELVAVLLKKNEDFLIPYLNMYTKDGNNAECVLSTNFDEYKIPLQYSSSYAVYKIDSGLNAGDFAIVGNMHKGEENYCQIACISATSGDVELHYAYEEMGEDWYLTNMKTMESFDFYDNGIDYLLSLEMDLEKLGLKGFLTGEDHPEDIDLYSDITPICKFSIQEEGNNRHFIYEDILY